MGQLPDWRDAWFTQIEDFDHRQGRTEPCRILSSEEPSRILIVLYGLIALSPIYVRGVCRFRANKDGIRERRAWTMANDRHSKSANQRIRRLWGVGRLNTTREIREISIIKNARLDATSVGRDSLAHLKKKLSGHHTRHPNHQTNVSRRPFMSKWPPAVVPNICAPATTRSSRA